MMKSKHLLEASNPKYLKVKKLKRVFRVLSILIVLFLLISASDCGGGTSIKKLNLTVTKAGTGEGTVTLKDATDLNCGTSCSANIIENTTVTLTATPKEGSKLSSWSGCQDNPTLMTCTVAMNGDKTVNVTFDLGNSTTQPVGEEIDEIVNGIPRLTLSTGQQVTLEPLSLVNELIKQFPPPGEGPPDASPLASSASFSTGLEQQSLTTTQNVPSRVFLGANQSSIKDQGSRGTCVAFTTAAALEAAYKRERGLELDLSEHYANHIQKMSYLPSEHNERSSENMLGAWGGSEVGYQLAHLFRTRYGLPPEESMGGIDWNDYNITYISESDYSNTDQKGDSPRLKWDDKNLSEKAVNSWNLNSTPTDYSIPSQRKFRNFPMKAKEDALYGVSRIRNIPNDLDAIRYELAAGRELAFGVDLTQPTPCLTEDGKKLPDYHPCNIKRNFEINAQYKDGIWHPLTTKRGGHAMLMVGYDDTKRVFIVKNSWGRNDEGKAAPIEADPDADGFIEMSYDWLPNMHRLYSILETRDINTWENQQVNLGMWNVEADNSLKRAELAIYHLPGALASYSFSDDQKDFRIGSLYQSGSIRYRVNGYMKPDYFKGFYQRGSSNNDLTKRYDDVGRGMEIIARKVDISPFDSKVMVGSIGPANSFETVVGSLGNGFDRKPFFASLDGYPNMQAARSDPVQEIAPIDYFGRWVILGDGLYGAVLFEKSNSSLLGVIEGSYEGSYEGTSYLIEGVTLQINPRPFQFDPDDPCKVKITIPFPTGSKTVYGKLFCDTTTSAKRALIVGLQTAVNGQLIPSSGRFYAYRQKLTENIVIEEPQTNGSVSKGERVTFKASVQGFTGTPQIKWSSSLDGDFLNTSGLSTAQVLTSYGTHTITATVDTSTGKISDSIQINAINDKPTINITIPFGSFTTICDGESTLFTADVRDKNQPSGLPDNAVTWSVAGTTFGTGKSVNYSFGIGSYTVEALVTDEQGETARDTIDISVISCSNTQPNVEITTPATDVLEYFTAEDSQRDQWYIDVTLRGMAVDTEDGVLSGESLVWETNRSDLQNQVLGTGNNIVVRLYNSQGTDTSATHIISLTATDSDGNTRTVFRTIEIRVLG